MPQEAVIYCRVSSERQAKEGDGVRSQEQRCRSHVQVQGYRLLCTFHDDGVSGAAIERPGLQAMLAFLRSRSGETVVVVDDISRIARDVAAHFQLRAAIKAAGGRLESPSFSFGDSAADELLETIMAATAQYGRKGNREQVLNRMRARLEMGYWTFPAPPGYRYERHPVHKKWLVPTEAARDILGPALEEFGRGRLLTQREIGVCLQEKRFWADRRPAPVTVLEKRVGRILEMLPLYAGELEYPSWNVARRPAQHAPIITRATLAHIEERLARKERPGAAPRADARDALALRNYIRCPACGRPLTGCLAKGQYPRYFCYWQQCPLYGHSHSARRKIEPAFVDLLRFLEPSPEFIELVDIYTPALWERVRGEGGERERTLSRELAAVREEMSGLVRRLGRVSDAVAEELEKEVAVLKEREAQVERKLAKRGEEPTDYREAWGRVSTWFRHPAERWENGSHREKRTVQRLVFSVPPVYHRETGFSTYDLTLPYRISNEFKQQKEGLVDSVAETLLSTRIGEAWFRAVFGWSNWLP